MWSHSLLYVKEDQAKSMPSQLNVVFFVPTKREWLWINGKSEVFGEEDFQDFADTEKNLKLPKSAIKDEKVTDSFFGFSYENSRAIEKEIILKYIDENGEVCATTHLIKVNRKGEGDFQVQFSNRNLPPLWKSKSQGGLVPGVEADDLLNLEEIDNPNYDDPEVANGPKWPKKCVLWFGKCEQTGDYWHGVLNDENIGAYAEDIKEIFDMMCDSRGARRNNRTGATEAGKAILTYRGAVEGRKVVCKCGGVRLSTKMSAGVLDKIKNGETNILLYGPPGTGKTFALQEFRSYLSSNLEMSVITIDETNTDAPLQVAQKMFEPAELNMPGEIKVWWTTFHQGVTYEDFVVGLRPRPEAGGITLEPRAGILLEAMEHARGETAGDGKSTPNTSVIIIDELNRGNVEAILGDFITAMDKDYRAPYKDEKLDFTSPMSIPMIFNNINGTTEPHGLGNEAKKSQEVRFASTGETKPIPLFSGGYKVPQTVIIVGTMNSVDRSIKPLDNALERRFVKVRCDPDYNVIRGTAARFGQELLRASNEAITQEFPDDGMDKTIGHSLMMKRKTGLNTVEECYEEWRKHVVPVLMKRFKGRHQQLKERLSKILPLLYPVASKTDLPDQEQFEFKKVLRTVKGIEGSQNKLRDFVCEMLPKKKEDILANLIENGVFEDSLFEKDEVKKEFSITDEYLVKWHQSSDEDETEPTDVPEEEWDDWKSAYTEKSLREVVESKQQVESEDGEIEDNEEGGGDGGDDQQPLQLNEDEIAEANNDIYLIDARADPPDGFDSKKSVRDGFKEYLNDEEKQRYDGTNAQGQKDVLRGARAARTEKWIERMGEPFEGDTKYARNKVKRLFQSNGVNLED